MRKLRVEAVMEKNLEWIAQVDSRWMEVQVQVELLQWKSNSLGHFAFWLPTKPTCTRIPNSYCWFFLLLVTKNLDGHNLETKRAIGDPLVGGGNTTGFFSRKKWRGTLAESWGPESRARHLILVLMEDSPSWLPQWKWDSLSHFKAGTFSGAGCRSRPVWFGNGFVLSWYHLPRRQLVTLHIFKSQEQA